MAGSTPLQQWRTAGGWPECLDAIWRKLEARHGKSRGMTELRSVRQVLLAQAHRQEELQRTSTALLPDCLQRSLPQQVQFELTHGSFEAE
jgi:hypothetical protein